MFYVIFSDEFYQVGIQHKMVLRVSFLFFEIIIFCFVVDICDLVHDVGVIHSLC